MAVDLRTNAPFVYSMKDYQAMFDLSSGDLQKVIMNCPAGLSSFNAEMTANGFAAFSADPAYHLSYDDLLVFIANELSLSQEQLNQHLIDQVGAEQKPAAYWSSLALFLADYQKAQKTRYFPFNAPALPMDEQGAHFCMLSGTVLPIENKHVQLLLLPYYFFHSENTVDELYHALMNWMSYVEEIRIFPIHDENHQEPGALAPLLLMLQNSEYRTELRAVEYSRQSEEMTNGHAMLRVWRRTCEVS